MKEALVAILTGLFIYGLFVEDDDYQAPPIPPKDEPKTKVQIKDNGEWIDK